ncbi:MAG: hypothetical protein A3F10_00170 [Coxiella sp. RIFCSPHIGHO2_12_FULL_42_15]|nr:MAG: hypothetical protein A3F10_00170 [Coxiella sp. RIFCSPHIGHO2_12_FULL_42_15]
MNDRKKAPYDQLKHISDVTFLEESSHLRLIFKGIIIVVTLIIAFIVWSAFVTVTETTKTMGQLIPEGQVQVVEHLEGGIVIQVLVKDGDLVKKDQWLIKLSTSEMEAELDQLRAQEIALVLKSERINAFLDNKPADKKAWGEAVLQSRYNPIVKIQEIEKMLNDQERLLHSEYQQLQSRKAALDNQLLQRKGKFSDLQQQKKVWEEHLRLLIKEFNMYEKLKENNYISQKDYLTVMRAVNQARGDGAKLVNEIDQAKEAIHETENKLKETDSTAREEALEELTKAHSDLREVYYKITKVVDRIQRSDVKAPLEGVVKGLAVYPGNVVKPGAVMLEVVPEGSRLIGETKVLPREIGYIHQGDPANVKVLTYDYARFGSIKGQLLSVSASTFLDQDGNPYYKAKIELSKQFIGPKLAPKKLKAGMTIQADIVTGSKTLLEYLLKPIHRSVTEAFQER